MDRVVFTFQRTKEDIMKQQVWQMYRKNKVIMALTLFFPILGIGFLVNSIIYNADPIVYFAVAYLILYPFVNYLFLKMRINKLFRNPDMEIERTEFTYAKEGITVKNAQGEELLVEWERVTNVYNMPDYIYVYVDKRSSVMVRKDLISESQVEFLLKLLKDSTAEKACNY